MTYMHSTCCKAKYQYSTTIPSFPEIPMIQIYTTNFMAVLAISLPETANNDEMNSFWHVDSLD